MYCWCHRTKQVLSCKSFHIFWLLSHCFDAIFHWLYFLNICWILDFYSAFFYILYHLILSHFLTSKSLFWCNLPLTILSEYPLNSRLLLRILLYPLPSNFCFFFDCPLFCYLFFFFNYYHHFFFNYLIPPPPCLCFYFGFHWFYTF